VRAVVVYESIYGNTRAIAEAIAAELEESADVAVVPVAGPGALHGARLLVVGGPTHMHGLSTSLSRRLAAQAAEEDEYIRVEPDAADGAGLRTWLSGLPGSGLSAAAFDTRLDRSAALTGAAARGIARRLHRRGCTLVAEPESFFVTDSEGPLEDGEAARARAWGAALGARIATENRSDMERARE
jgi:hypothetical protein